RHTRSDRDWSSDVCSSDLRLLLERVRVRGDHGLPGRRHGADDPRGARAQPSAHAGARDDVATPHLPTWASGSVPSTSPFMSGRWRPPSARALRSTCSSTYSYSSETVTTPSPLRSALPASPWSRKYVKTPWPSSEDSSATSLGPLAVMITRPRLRVSRSRNWSLMLPARICCRMNVRPPAVPL